MNSLKDKIFLYILLPLVLVIMGFLLFNFSINRVIDEHFQGHAVESATKLSYIAKDAILLGDKKVLSSIIFDERYLSSGIDFIAVYNKNGEILADTDLGQEQNKPFFLQPVGREEFTQKAYFINENIESDRLYLIDIPVQAGLNDVGLVRVVFNFSKLTEELSTMAKYMLVYGVLFFILLIFLASSLTKTVVAPIKNLTKVAQEYANGNFDSFAKVVSLDEIGDLAVAFNMMKSSIEESQTTLLKEKKVVEAKATELEAWQKTAVARELKMVELKKKINKLELIIKDNSFK